MPGIRKLIVIFGLKLKSTLAHYRKNNHQQQISFTNQT